METGKETGKETGLTGASGTRSGGTGFTDAALKDS
jgi:hypothetical protein